MNSSFQQHTKFQEQIGIFLERGLRDNKDRFIFSNATNMLNRILIPLICRVLLSQLFCRIFQLLNTLTFQSKLFPLVIIPIQYYIAFLEVCQRFSHFPSIYIGIVIGKHGLILLEGSLNLELQLLMRKKANSEECITLTIAIIIKVFG